MSGAAVGLGLALALSGAIVWMNPRFLDSFTWTFPLFHLIPAVLGGLLGIAWSRAWCVVGETSGPSSRPRRLDLRRPLRILGALFACALALFAYSSTRSAVVDNGREKVILIGLDGATWEIIDQLREQGDLPNLSALIDAGASGVLRSEEPTISPAVWTTIATGKHPSKHGIRNFLSLQRNLEAKRVWEILEGNGRSIGVMGWMLTWPPRLSHRGFMIPSHLARGPETLPPSLGFLQEMVHKSRQEGTGGAAQKARWGADAVRSGVRLSTLVRALQEWLYEVAVRPPYLEKNYRQQHIALQMYTDLFLALRQRYQPDFSTVVFYGTDTLAHKYWRYFEPSKFADADPGEVRRYASVIPDYYRAVDRALGDIRRSMDGRTTLLIVSDHGTQAMPDGKVLRVPRLRAESLMQRLGVLDRVEVTTVGNQAFVHAKSHEGEESGALLAAIAGRLQRARLEGVEDQLLHVETVPGQGGAGSYLGVEFNLLPSLAQAPAGESAVDLGDGLVMDLAKMSSIDFPVSGTHHLNGVLIMEGPSIRRTRLSGPRITDVTPTILYLLGLPVARDMDGEALVGGMEAAFLSQREVRYVDSHGGGAPPDEQAGEPALSEEVRRELQSLGYLN